MTISLRNPCRAGALALLGALSVMPAFALPTIAIHGPVSVLPGGAVQVDVSASGFTDLYAYQFDLIFNPSRFSATGVSQGAFLATAGSTFFDSGLIDNATGTVSFVIETLIGPGTGANGNGDLLHVSFDAVGPQYSSGSFTLANVIAFDSALNPINVAQQDLTVLIPEPSAWALASMAGVLLAASRRSRRRPGEVGARG